MTGYSDHDRGGMDAEARERAAEMMSGLRETREWRDGAMMLGLASELAALRAERDDAQARLAVVRALLAAGVTYGSVDELAIAIDLALTLPVAAGSVEGAGT